MDSAKVSKNFASDPVDENIQNFVSIGEGLHGHRNSLNFVRLFLATVVIASHAIQLGGFGDEASYLHGTTFGTVAVYSFFGISGYLVAQSALSTHTIRYFWKRSLRIFPGAWVCLILISLFFGIIGWVSVHHANNGLSAYFHSVDNPVSFIYRNLPVPTPWSIQESISGTPQNVPVPLVWNGQMWTLFYELSCYALLGLLVTVGVFRKRFFTLIFATVFWLFDAAITFIPALNHQFNFFTFSAGMNFFKFGSIFLVGTVLYVYRNEVPDSGWLALVLACLFFLSLWLPGSHPVTSAEVCDLFVPLIVYPVLWLGIHLPFQKIGRRNDYSYGIYIYAVPVAQILALWHVQRLGYFGYLAATLVATAPFAVGSWWLVERPAMSLKNVQFRSKVEH
jgi:peptidoglycan/LPS O-acetylase OafA/YrhL